MCNGKQVWPQILDTKDFQNGNLSPYPENKVPPQTKFSIVKAKKMRYVLAVEVRSKMRVFMRIARLQHAAKEWLSGIATDEDEVGIVSFR